MTQEYYEKPTNSSKEGADRIRKYAAGFRSRYFFELKSKDGSDERCGSYKLTERSFVISLVLTIGCDLKNLKKTAEELLVLDRNWQSTLYPTELSTPPRVTQEHKEFLDGISLVQKEFKSQNTSREPWNRKTKWKNLTWILSSNLEDLDLKITTIDQLQFLGDANVVSDAKGAIATASTNSSRTDNRKFVS